MGITCTLRRVNETNLVGCVSDIRVLFEFLAPPYYWDSRHRSAILCLRLRTRQNELWIRAGIFRKIIGPTMRA
jgi:hypothetical protein